jgi:hypothetical protein
VEAVTGVVPAIAALAALVAAGAPGGRGGDGDPCTLRVSADPHELLLGESARATLRIETGGMTAPRVTSSVGRVGTPRQVGPGVFEAELHPPDPATPEIAIVAAFDGDACGWTAIRLVGQGEAVVRSTPGARIVVRIAERTFGPVRADRGGVARLPVVVPPGVRVAYHGDEAIALDAPPVRRLHVVLDRASARADVDADIRLRVFATTEEGAPWTGAKVEASATAGEVQPLAEIAPGELVGRWHLQAGMAGDEALRARIAGGTPEAVARLSRIPGPVDRVDIVPLAPATATEDEVPVEVRTTDSAGNPVDAAIVPRAHPGTASAPTRVSAGLARFAVFLPNDAEGCARVDLTVAAGAVTARSALPLVPGAPARIEAVPSAPVLTADGRSTGRLRVAVLDRRGVPVPSASPRVEAPGLVAAVESERPGLLVVSYRSPYRADDAMATLRVDADGLASEAQVRILGARARLEVVPAAGVALTGRRAWLETTLQVAGWTRRLGPDLGLALEAGQASTSERAGAAAGTPPLDASARYLWLLARAGWRLATSQRTLLWASAGAGAARATSTMSVEGAPSFTESTWVPTAAASIAWGIRAWRGFPFLEVGARWQGDPGLSGLSGALFPFTISAGYRLEAL